MTGPTIRVAVVDDQQLVRDGFALILGSQPDIEVAVQAEDGRQFLEAVRADPRLDVALVDIRMPVLDGLAATRALAAVPHAPAVIVVTTFDDDVYVLDAIAGRSTWVPAQAVQREGARRRGAHRGCRCLDPVGRRHRSGPRPGARCGADHECRPGAVPARPLARPTCSPSSVRDSNNAEIAARLHLSMSK